MIAFTTIGADELPRATALHDALVAGRGGRRAVDPGDAILRAGSDGGPRFVITRSADGDPAGVGDGAIIALASPEDASIARVHARAIQFGAGEGRRPGRPHRRTAEPLRRLVPRSRRRRAERLPPDVSRRA